MVETGGLENRCTLTGTGGSNPSPSAIHIGTNLTQLSDGRTVAHLINHNYSKGFQEQDGVSVSFPVAKAPRSVTLVSPDYEADAPVAFIYSGGQVQVTVPKLVAYVAVVSN